MRTFAFVALIFAALPVARRRTGTFSGTGVGCRRNGC